MFNLYKSKPFQLLNNIEKLQSYNNTQRVDTLNLNHQTTQQAYYLR